MKVFINEEIKKIDFLDERFYLINGEYYPSVTHILQSYPKGYGLTQWQKTMGAEADVVLQRAAESGSKVHNAIDMIIKGETLVFDDKKYNTDEWVGISNAVDFFTMALPEIITNEQTVYSKELKYAGTMDLLCVIKGETWLIDFKFSNAVYDTHFLQLAAYKKAIEENAAIKIDRFGVLHLKSKNRKYDPANLTGVGYRIIEPVESYETLIDVFSKVRDLYYFINPNPAPKNMQYPSELKLARNITVEN